MEQVRIEKTKAGVMKLYYGQVVGIVLGSKIHMLAPNNCNSSHFRLNGQRYACICKECYQLGGVRDDILDLLLLVGKKTLPEVNEIVVYTNGCSGSFFPLPVFDVERHDQNVADGWEIGYKRT